MPEAIAILGVAYKRNVDDPRESPFFRLRDILQKKGAVLNVFDSWVTSENTVDSIDDAIQQSLKRNEDQAVAVIPEGPYVVPFYRPATLV